jgi:hypothetical protein
MSFKLQQLLPLVFFIEPIPGYPTLNTNGLYLRFIARQNMACPGLAEKA